MISNIRKNCMGSVSFDAVFPGMRKPQDFIVYPIKADDSPAAIRIQSGKRSGFVSMVSGAVSLYPGQYFNGPIKQVVALNAEQLLLLKSAVMASASGQAGKAENGVIQCDNSGALGVFGL